MLLAKLLNDPVTASQQSLMQIFSDEYVFTVPSYQRPYSWETAQALALLHDVRKACEVARTTYQQETYFFGSIVLIKKPAIPACEIVDGQQRMTTLTILLALLRDLSSDPKVSEDNSFLCAEGNRIRGTAEKYRLTIRDHDKIFFETAIQRPGATRTLSTQDPTEEVRRRIIRIAAALKEELQAMRDGERDDLMAFLIQRCFMVVIAIASEESAHRIFRALNTRGLELSPTDILKADLLDALRPKERKHAAQAWESYETKLGQDDFAALFAHILMIHHRNRLQARLDGIFAQHVHEFRTNPRAFAFTTLENYVGRMHEIQTNSAFKQRYGREADKVLSSLHRLDNEDWKPCLLLYLHKYQGGPDLIGFLGALERCAYFLAICQMNSARRIERYAGALAQIDGATAYASPQASPSFALHLRDTEKWQLLRKLDEPIYGNPKICKPLLLRIDATFTDALADYDYEATTIEHIVPQKPSASSEWSTIFKDEEERSQWIDALGNLVLLSQSMNSRAGNLPFARKKEQYFSSKDKICSFALTTSLMKEPTFDLATLKERHERLKTRIAQAWQLDPSQGEAAIASS